MKKIRRRTRSDAGTERPTCDTVGDGHENNMSHRYHYIVLQTGGFEALRALRGTNKEGKRCIGPWEALKALIRPIQGSGLIRPLKGLIRPLKGLPWLCECK